MTTNKAELNKELTRALRQYGADYGFAITDKNIEKLIEAAVFDEIHLNRCGGKLLAETLMKFGKVLEQSDDEKSYIAIVRAGVANMNYALLALKLDGEDISIAAVAKEGLIKQGTAKGAVEKVIRNLREKQ